MSYGIVVDSIFLGVILGGAIGGIAGVVILMFGLRGVLNQISMEDDTMTHVYLVYSGAYENRGVEALFTTPEKAHQFAEDLKQQYPHTECIEVERRLLDDHEGGHDPEVAMVGDPRGHTGRSFIRPA